MQDAPRHDGDCIDKENGFSVMAVTDDMHAQIETVWRKFEEIM